MCERKVVNVKMLYKVVISVKDSGNVKMFQDICATVVVKNCVSAQIMLLDKRLYITSLE